MICTDTIRRLTSNKESPLWRKNTRTEENEGLCDILSALAFRRESFSGLKTFLFCATEKGLRECKPLARMTINLFQNFSAAAVLSFHPDYCKSFLEGLRSEGARHRPSHLPGKKFTRGPGHTHSRSNPPLMFLATSVVE